MNDQIETLASEEFIDVRAVADIQRDVREAVASVLQPLQIPQRVARGTEKHIAHVVVHAKHFVPLAIEMPDRLGANQSAASGNQDFHRAVSLSKKARPARRSNRSARLADYRFSDPKWTGGAPATDATGSPPDNSRQSPYRVLATRDIALHEAKEYALGTMKKPRSRASSRADHAIFRRRQITLAAIVLCAIFAPSSFAQGAVGKDAGLRQIRSYIAVGWDTLTRSLTDCKVIVDPKLAAASVLYLPADLDVPADVLQMQKRCNVQVKHLPRVIHKLGEVDTSNLEPPGLLYLNNKYVVPGGRFNEMYGWDSYFIVRGLVEDNRIDLAQGMVENFFFEIEHYGAVLNANRTYYLTRSQPPFLTSMILAVYNARPMPLVSSLLKDKAVGEQDRAWLARAYEYAKRDYALWTHEPHLEGSTGLSRYYDFGNGAASESVKDETGHYLEVAAAVHL